MTFRDLMARHARRTLTDPNKFGESITYHFASGDPDRTVPALVNRQGRIRDDDADLSHEVAHVLLPVEDSDQENGIPGVAKGDEITLPIASETSTPVRARVTRQLDAYPGAFTVEVVA